MQDNPFGSQAPVAAATSTAPNPSEVLRSYGVASYNSEQLAAMPSDQLVAYRSSLAKAKDQLSGDVHKVNGQIEATNQRLEETREQAQQHFGASTVEGLRLKESEILADLQSALSETPPAA